MQCIYIASHNHTNLQKHDKLRPNSWSPALHCVSRPNSQHLHSPRQRCAGTNGDRRKGMIYQILGISCGWRTLVAGLQHWQQFMATQSTPAFREGSVITRRPDRGLRVTSARTGTVTEEIAPPQRFTPEYDAPLWSECPPPPPRHSDFCMAVLRIAAYVPRHSTLEL